MKMRALETERTSSPNVNITAYIQPRGASRSNGTFQRLCGTLWSWKNGAPKQKKLLAPKPKSWFVRQKVLGANIHETEGLLERNIAIISPRVIINAIIINKISSLLIHGAHLLIYPVLPGGKRKQTGIDGLQDVETIQSEQKNE